MLRTLSSFQLFGLAAFVAASVGILSTSCGDETLTAAGGSGIGGQLGSGGTIGTGGKIDPLDMNCTHPSPEPAVLTLKTIAFGLDHPIFLTVARGDKSRLFVIEQPGSIRIIKDGQLLPEPFLDIRSLIATENIEQGLLGLAFHPNYKNNGRFFVHYSDKATGDAVVAEYRRGESEDKADPDVVDTLLSIPDPQITHNGGALMFSPLDDMLYIGLGDGGGAGDKHGACGNGQNKDSLLGKILRLDVSTTPYTPAGAKIEGARPEIWDFGLRNPWRFSFDGCTGDLYIGDVGQDTFEELNIEPAGKGGKNYGWRCSEGFIDTPELDNTGCPCAREKETAPMITIAHPESICIIGGYVYRGSKIPSLRGTYFFADFRTKRVWSTRYENGETTPRIDHTLEFGNGTLSITSFGQDNDGEIYMTEYYGGAIYRIEAL
jgi:glucose/arabinose dehydrogenase